jgi:hypothetical protein
MRPEWWAGTYTLAEWKTELCLPGERWLVVADWWECYDVSDLGRVRSRDRQAWGSPPRHLRGQIMSQRLKDSYWHVNLRHGGRDGHCWKAGVHQLVTRAFHGPPPPGHEVCHGPAGCRDNRWTNLRWGTHVENMADQLRDGTKLRGVNAYKTVCKRGHDRVPVNLGGAKGMTCLACWYAVQELGTGAEPGAVQVLSDKIYAGIMGAA